MAEDYGGFIGHRKHDGGDGIAERTWRKGDGG